MPSYRHWITPLLVLIAIFQVIYFLSRRSPTVPKLQNVSPYMPNMPNAPNLPAFLGGKNQPPSSFSAVAEIKHPVAKLMEDAESEFRRKVNGQSRTLSKAVEEYERRYKRSPPRGFDDWFKFAVDNNVRIIDEYDSMVKDLRPFENMSGEELRARALQVGMLPSIHLVRIQNGKSKIVKVADFKDSEVNARARGFEVMIEKFVKKLPDMDVPVNAKAEGRILVPWEHQQYPNLTSSAIEVGVEKMLGGKFIPDWRGDGNVWEAFRRTCPPDSQARKLFSSLRGDVKPGQQPLNHFKDFSFTSEEFVGTGTGGGGAVKEETDFEFAKGGDDTFDFCANPWARYKQGHFFSDWRTIPVQYPIFSPAKAAGFGDILIPSHYYHAGTPRYTYGWDAIHLIVKERADGETPWENKTNLVFWRGATTGGGSSPPGFLKTYQRHRFIRMTSDHSNSTHEVTFAWPPTSSDSFVTVTVPSRALNEELIDSAFTNAVGCVEYPGGCAALEREHRFADTVPLGEHWRHKYLIDFDGMGYSARVFALLASDSAVVKSTVYREFFSDWIQPWLHYIPLSMSYKEIYNIHAYFSGPSPAMMKALNETYPEMVNSTLSGSAQQMGPERRPPGDEALERIAKAGRKWKNTIARKVDMEAYVYRLCLEYARLLADDREAWTYKHTKHTKHS